MGSQSVVCKPIAQLRRFESFTCHHVLKGPLTCRNAVQGPSRVPRMGIQNGVSESGNSAFGRRPVTCTNADERASGVGVPAEYVRKYVFAPRAAPTDPPADLCRCHGGVCNDCRHTSQRDSVAVVSVVFERKPSHRSPIRWLGGPVTAPMKLV